MTIVWAYIYAYVDILAAPCLCPIVCVSLNLRPWHKEIKMIIRTNHAYIEDVWDKKLLFCFLPGMHFVNFFLWPATQQSIGEWVDETNFLNSRKCYTRSTSLNLYRCIGISAKFYSWLGSFVFAVVKLGARKLGGRKRKLFPPCSFLQRESVRRSKDLS